MKVEFQRLIDPSEETLNKLGAQGFHFVGCGTTYEMHHCTREEHFVVILQREVPEATESTSSPVDVENAMYRGVRDAVGNWLGNLPTPDARKIFGSQSS